MDSEMMKSKTCDEIANRNRNSSSKVRDTVKDKVRSSLSDPNPKGSSGSEGKVARGSGSERRARWLNKVKFNNPSVHKDSSGYQNQNEDQEPEQPVPSLQFFPNSNGTGSLLTRRIVDPVNAKYKWRRRGCSQAQTQLSPIRSDDDTPDDPVEEPMRASRSAGLSRQNGIRQSLVLRSRRSRSRSPPYSISSESEVSQKESPPKTRSNSLLGYNGDCDNSHDPSDKVGLDTADQDQTTGQRKQSVFFSSYGVWSEESVMKSFRDLSPDISSFLEAAWNGQVGQIDELLKVQDIDIECRDSKGRTPLHLAAAGGHAGTVELLLRKGAQVDPRDSFENATPLMCASAAGSLASVEILLESGANVNAGYESGKTPLHWAVQAGSVECAEKLLETGAKQNPPIVYSENPLHISASLGDVACLKLLLHYGADVSLCRGANRSTVLHIAAEEGNASCIRVLIKAGADMEASDSRGHTPLHVAASVDAECTSILLAAGANPNSKDKDGRSPLHSAISRGSRASDCVRLLVENQAEINAQDSFGYTALHLAAVNESSQCSSILLHHGADVTMKTKAGTTALSLLVRRIPDVMRFLVDRLDSAVTIHDHDPGDPDCEVRLDFRAVVPNSDKRLTKNSKKYPEREYYHKPRKETEFLTCVLAAGNKKILNHPLSEAFLTLKWQRVRKFFWASLLFQVALVILFTIFVCNVYLMKCELGENENSGPCRARKTLLTTTEPTLNNSGPIEPTLPPVIDPKDGTAPSIPDITSTTEHPKIRRNIILPGPQNTSISDVQPINPIDNSSSHSRTKRAFDPFSFNGVRKKKKKTTTPPTTMITPTTTRKPGSFDGFSIRIGTLSRHLPQNDTIETMAEKQNETMAMDTEEFPKLFTDMATWLTVIWCLLLAFTILMAVKETFQLMQAPKSYVTSSENWGQWALIATVVCSAWPGDIPNLYIYSWQYLAAAYGMLLAWGLMLLQVGRFPALGIYVQMLGKVAANFGIVILAYACLLIAFALAFCVIFPGEPQYSSIPNAILKVLTMMVGEVDYEEVFYPKEEDDELIPYPFTSHLLHGIFVVIVTIVLMNLLVGLAVSDIQGLQKGAKLNRLSRQTALISRLESFIFSKRLQAILPHSVGLILQRSALLVPSSYKWSYYFRPNDLRDKRLSKELKQSALRLASAKHSSKHIKKHHNYDHDYHTSFNNNSLVPHISSTDASLKRMEERLDMLQDQMETILQNLTIQNEAMKIVLNQQGNIAPQI